MSLETAIEENTKVLRELLARLSAGAVPLATIGTGSGDAKADEKKSEVAATTTAAATSSTAGASAVQETKAEPSAKPLDYDAIKLPFLALGKAKGGAACADLLAKYEVKNLKEIPVEKFAEVLADIQKAAA